MKFMNLTLLIAVSTSVAFMGTATAEDVVDELVVTAMKREQTIQDVPFSINAQTQQDIQRTGATDLEDLSRNVAGLSIQNLGPGQSQVAVRGVSAGQIVRDQPGVKEQVGIYLDESVISLSLFTPDLDLFDLNRVETLRGPQGTLFGSGSVGGTIRYITNQPDVNDFDALVEADLNSVTDGDVGGHLKGAVNIPVADGKAALRLVGYHTEYAGFIDALGEGGTRQEDVNDGNRTGGRIALAFMPTEDITITPRIIYQETEANGFNRQEVFNLFANPYTTTRPAIQLGEREQYLLLNEEFTDEILIADATIEIAFGDLDFISISSYTDRDILVSRDASALTDSVSIDALGFPEDLVLIPSNLRDTTEVEQFTQEFRLSSSGEGRFQWLVGAFYSDTERDYAQRLPTPGYDAAVDSVLGAGTSEGASNNGFAPPDSPFTSALPYDIEQIAIFGEGSYDVTDALQLTAGFRWYDFDEERRFTTGGVFANSDDQVDSTSSDGITPRIMASYDLNDDVTLNAQASQGFRLGGVNDPLNLPLCTPEDEAVFGSFQSYDDETLWNYEGGVKANIGSAVTLNAAVYYTDIEDLQATLDAGSCSSRITFNVPEAHTLGGELELFATPTEGLDLSMAISVLEAEFDSTVRDGNGNVIGGLEDGNRLPSVAEFQFAATGTYTWPMDLFGTNGDAYVSGTFHYIDDRITQASDQLPGAGDFQSMLPFGGATGDEVTSIDLELDSYSILNLRLGYMFDTWETVLYVDNATDENANLSFDRERGGRARLGFRTNTPRTIGLTIRKSFSGL